MPFITQGKTNWKFLLIVVVLAAIVGGGILWCEMKQEIPTPEFLKAKKTEERVAAKEIILSDEEIVEILKEFAAKITARFRDAEVDKILLDALEFKNTDTRDRLHNLIGKFEDLSETIEDAPDLRSWKVQRTKLCLAESIISDDLENTTQRCGYEAESSFTGADDLLADTQIISFFINGFAHYYKEDYPKADYYFDQIKLHYSFLESFEVDFSAKHLELYNKIYNKVSEISSEVVKDETADWQTYTNEEYGFEVKYPEDWNLEENITGPSLSHPPLFITNLYTARGIGPGLQDWHSIPFWIEVYNRRAPEKTMREWLSEGCGEDLSEIKNGGGIGEALKKAYAGKSGFVSYRETQKRDIYIYEVGEVWKASLFYTAYLTKGADKYIYGIGLSLQFEENEELVSTPDSKYAEIFNQILSTFRFLE